MTHAPAPASLLRPELASLSAYHVPAAPMRVRLDANESPWALPDTARRAMADAMGRIDLHRYPDPSASALRAAIATYAGAKQDELSIGVGSDELIATLITALARPRRDATSACVLFPDPSFVMYGLIARARGVRAVTVPLSDHFDLDAARWVEAIAAERPNLVFLPTPNNPTGNAFDQKAITAIVEAARDSVVVLDEAYVEFVTREDARNVRRFFDHHPNVVLLGTLSKMGLAALRVGWARARPTLALELEKVRLPYNLPAPTQVAATVALGELLPALREHVRAIIAERARLGPALAALRGLEVFPTDANFFLARVTNQSTADVAAKLAARSVRVRVWPGHASLGEHMRITVGTPTENDALLSALEEALA